MPPSASPPTSTAPAGERHWVIPGRLADGRSPEQLTDAELAQRRDSSTGRHRFDFASGARVDGRLDRATRAADGRLLELPLSDVRVALPDLPPLELARYILLALGDVVTARAGAVDARFHDNDGDGGDGGDGGACTGVATAAAGIRVPRPRTLPARERRLLDLYQQAERAHRGEGDPIATVFPRVHAALIREFPDEWLLRWNLLESVLARAAQPGQSTPALRGLADRLGAELERLEVALDRRQPIASGLRALAALTATRIGPLVE
jgi:hypothetical protein